jgi:hypothetical protein
MFIERLAAAAIVYLALSACTHETVSPTSQSESAPVAQAQPATTEVAQAEFDTATMQRAVQSGKLSAPVDVLYRFSDDVAPDRPVRVDFAVSPRVPGDNLRFELVNTDAAVIETADANLTVQKADASGVYRKSVTLTPRAGLNKLQVIVYMSVGADTYSGVYSIPVSASAVEKSKDGKQPLKRDYQ